MGSVKVFVKEGCSRCPGAMDVAGKLRREGYEVYEYDLDTAEGMAEGAFFGVMSTPTMLVVDSLENAVTAWRGEVPSHSDVKSALKAANF